MRIVDLRSDTVTLPTAEMMKAIMNARLGDDQYREDPTVSELQQKAAAKLGKEDALLVVSGTQANLASVMSLTTRGDKVVLDAESHIYCHEAGGLSSIAGVIPYTVRSRLGVPDAADIEAASQIEHKYHEPKATLLCLENTHAKAGGTCITEEQTRQLASVARAHDMHVHLDGARIFNAAVALGTDVKSLVRDADSVDFCLSKGLSCPIGSIVAGDREFIEKTRRNRQVLGGAMRQAGIIAAPGLVALETMIDRLREDHENAKRLAKGLASLGIKIEMERVQTNMVLIDTKQLGVTSAQFISQVDREGVKAGGYDPTTVRMVTHRGIRTEDIDYALEAIERVTGRARRNQ